MNYFKILKSSYQTTINHPGLWFFGLFLAGGFNANYFYWFALRTNYIRLVMVWFTSEESAPLFIHLILGLVVVAILFIVANWAKVAFILRVSNIFKLQRMRSNEELEEPDTGVFEIVWRESPGYLFSVIAMSLFTVAGMTAVTIILGGSPSFLFNSYGVIWVLATIVFVIFAFFFSWLNFFGAIFIIFYKKQFSSALNLAFDLITSRLRAILEMSIILIAIYFSLTFLIMQASRFLPMPALGWVLIWLGQAIINTFFNVSLILLFSELVKPPYLPENKKLMTEASAAASH